MQDIPLYVINLPASQDRRQSIEAQLAALGLQATIFEAVNGRGSHPLFAHVDAAKRLARKGRPFRPGEIGCWASHYLLWQRCVDSGKPMIVLEDDITVEASLPGVIASLQALPEHIGYFRLHSGDSASQPWARFGDFVLHRYWRSPLCTFGYYLAPSAARKFLQHADEWVLPVDDYMDLAWLHGVECLGLKPGVVHSGGEFDSTIRGDGKPKQKVGAWGLLQREGFRAGLSLRWFLHNLPARLGAGARA